MPSRTPANPLNDIYKMLGAVEADVRTIKHSQNNATMKLDVIGTVVTQIEELVEARRDHEKRLNTLEDESQRRQGAVGLLGWFARHWPFSVIVVAVFAFWTWLNGAHGP